MSPAHRDLMAAVEAQSIATTGPWFTHHLRSPSETFEFEIGVPVARPVAPETAADASRYRTELNRPLLQREPRSER